MLRIQAFLVLMLGGLPTAALLAEEKPDTAPPIGLWVIIDAGASTREVRQELQTIAEAAINSLKPNDRLWILSAHADGPQVRAIRTVGDTDTLATAISPVLKAIQPGLLFDADLAAALKVPLLYVENNAQSASRVLVVIVTDGRRDSDQAERILAGTRELSAHGVTVIVTGTAKSSRVLLMAAAQGRLRWYLLAESDPVAWLAQVRQRARASGQTPVRPAVSPPTAERPKEGPAPVQVLPATPGQASARKPLPPRASAPPLSPSPQIQEPNPPVDAAARHREVPQQHGENTAGPSSAPSPGQPPGPNPSSRGSSERCPVVAPAATQADGNSNAQASSARTPSSLASAGRRATASQTAPAVVGHQDPGRRIAATEVRRQSASTDPRRTSLSAQEDPVANFADNGSTSQPASSSTASAERPALSRPASTPAEPVITTSRPARALTWLRFPEPSQTGRDPRPFATQPQTSAVQPPATTPSISAAARDSSQSGGTGARLKYALLLVGAAACVALALLATDWCRNAWRNARSARPKDDDQPDQRRLYARANGRTFALGLFADIRRLEIGASGRAAIPLTGEGILPRHATLTRDGDGFWIRNRSPDPITANGIAVPPRRRARLLVPAEISLADKARVVLTIRRSADHEDDNTT